MSGISHQKLTGWMVPALLTGALGILTWMATNLNRISESLAVVVYRLENHEKRIDVLESNHIR